MRYARLMLFGAILALLDVSSASAQLTNNENAAGNVSGQDGQSNNFQIQRDASSFIGGAASTILGAQGGTGTNTALRGGLSGIGGLGGFGRGNTGLGGQANTQATFEPQIRFRITLGFSYPRVAGPKISAQFARRLTRIPQLASARMVSVSMEDRTAVLAGQVESEHERTLIEKLALMEPGVSEVRNEMTVKAMPELLPLPEATN
ncbi:MAG: BON domain-containing protein [Planctomycetes bacterium]|nr:BON domain-containing protein [Planctomycetota bacterium]